MVKVFHYILQFTTIASFYMFVQMKQNCFLMTNSLIWISMKSSVYVYPRVINYFNR